MKETNYLTSSSKEATYKRLLETTLFVIDAMTDMTIGTGRGWKSAVRVRILHAQVRRRIRLGKGKLNTYDENEMGIPINQQSVCLHSIRKYFTVITLRWYRVLTLFYHVLQRFSYSFRIFYDCTSLVTS